ncbi:hypothetical protein SO802_020098 [Lithocarpus litseifolius]|uniref:RNase H type-1 domain-containing protein n=1 Tax=Lithocarpus litseifolius TaxID=425828 RepID=A0AAW2CBG2_9ROSI
MEASIQESMIQELTIQVSMIQESKIQAPTTLIVSESNEVLRIQEHFKIQRTNETLKIEEPLKAQEFEQSLKIYKAETFICTGPLVKEKCKNMVIKMSLRLNEKLQHTLFVIQVQWHPFPDNWLKLNSDGSSLGNPGRAGGGGIIRNSRGEWVSGYARAIGHTSSVAAELWALRDGINLCIALNLTDVI